MAAQVNGVKCKVFRQNTMGWFDRPKKKQFPSDRYGMKCKVFRQNAMSWFDHPKKKQLPSDRFCYAKIDNQVPTDRISRVHSRPPLSIQPATRAVRHQVRTFDQTGRARRSLLTLPCSMLRVMRWLSWLHHNFIETDVNFSDKFPMLLVNGCIWTTPRLHVIRFLVCRLSPY